MSVRDESHLSATERYEGNALRVNEPGQITLNRDENFGPPFFPTALSNNSYFNTRTR